MEKINVKIATMTAAAYWRGRLEHLQINNNRSQVLEAMITAAAETSFFEWELAAKCALEMPSNIEEVARLMASAYWRGRLSPAQIGGMQQPIYAKIVDTAVEEDLDNWILAAKNVLR